MKTAVIGCGQWAANIIRVLNSISELKYVVDINSNNFDLAKQTYKNVKFTTDINDVINSDVEAVAIVTPPNTHYPIALKLGEKFHLFVEKPLASTRFEAHEFMKFKKKVNCVGHTFLFSSEIQEIKRLIEEGELGEIEYINILRLNFGRYQECGIKFDLLPHDISIIRYILDNNTNLKIDSASYIYKNKISVAGQLSLTNGKTQCIINSSWIHTEKTRKVIVVGSKKTVEYDMSSPYKLKLFDKRKLDDNNAGEAQVIEIADKKEALTEELKYWLTLIKDKKQKNIISFKDGYQVVSLIEGIKQYEVGKMGNRTTQSWAKRYP